MTESAPESGFFHCGRCGAVFAAQPGTAVARRCPECGNDPVPPSTRREPPETTTAPGNDGDAENQGAHPGGTVVVRQGRGHAKRHPHKPPAIRKVVIFIGVWVVLLAVFAVWMKVLDNQDTQQERERSSHFKESRRAQHVSGLDRSMQERERVFLAEAFPKCQTAFLSFLGSTTPESRSQWVAGGPAMVGKMSRFQSITSLFLPAEAPELDYVGVIETTEGPLVESLWKSKAGYRIEVVFRHERGEWRIDWESFARFSEIPWAMFAAGAGQEVQEFRLYARERLAGDRKMDPALSVVLHPPRFGRPDEVGTASPEFVVPRMSKAGRKLDTLFRLHKEGKFPLGAKVPAEDPEGMIRVRLKIQRSLDLRGTRKFEIEDVLAGHWLSVTDSGIPEDDPDSAAEKPAPDHTGSAK